MTEPEKYKRKMQDRYFRQQCVDQALKIMKPADGVNAVLTISEDIYKWCMNDDVSSN